MAVINTNAIQIGSTQGVTDSFYQTVQDPTWWWVIGIVVFVVIVLIVLGVVH